MWIINASKIKAPVPKFRTLIKKIRGGLDLYYNVKSSDILLKV